MKRTSKWIFLVLLMVFAIITVSSISKRTIFKNKEMEYIAKVEGKSFYVYVNKGWQEKFLKGVNMGLGKPGYFPGELAITKDEYMRWFKYISDMNADVIRVYTTLKPEFYNALYEFNKSSKKPLYIVQGVWVKEETMTELKDAYASDGKIKKEFIKDAQDLVDIFHGDANLPTKRGFASGKYTKDISPYVIGWILGIEWDSEFVDTTDKNNKDKSSYDGKYLYTKDAPAFETFLAEVGDKIVDYEKEEYGMTRPVSYTNWLPTDPLKHPNEPMKKEDMVSVDVELIKARKDFKPGVFASYHVYPYYPEFMNYQKEYTSIKDEEGKINTYKAYLKELFGHHTMPVLIAEFGVPASRGIAHESVYSGYNQGNIDETQQGMIITKLLNDIKAEGYCGAFVFGWQDEWFKRTWNTMEFDLPDMRPFWSNPQTNEQEFGVMAFDPGENKSICYVDGDVSDWENDKYVYRNKDVTTFVKSDEKYVYIMADTNNFDFTKDSLVIPIDTIEGQGNRVYKDKKLRFEKAADFVININGKDNSRILVDANYDSFYYMYAEQLDMVKKNSKYKKKGTGIFNPMYLCLCREMVLPEDNKKVPFSKFETGKLRYGDANPEHEGYNSLNDYCVKNGKVEIRIPWQLLNVMNPSTKEIMGDLYKNNGIKPQKVDKFHFGAEIVKKGEKPLEISMGDYTLQGWDFPKYHERLKPSYYILKKAFDKIN